MKGGLIALPQVMWTRCMLHKESLVSKEMSELSDVMDSIVKAVNFVKKCALQTCLHTLLYFTILRFDGFHMEQCCHTCWRYTRLFGSFTSPKPCRAGCKFQ